MQINIEGGQIEVWSALPGDERLVAMKHIWVKNFALGSDACLNLTSWELHRTLDALMEGVERWCIKVSWTNPDPGVSVYGPYWTMHEAEVAMDDVLRGDEFRNDGQLPEDVVAEIDRMG